MTSIEKTALRQYEIAPDPELLPEEKEVTIRFENRSDRCVVHSEVPTVTKWLLSVEESEVTNHRAVGGRLVALTATIPKGLLHLKPKPRKSNQNSQIVSYGPNK